MPETCSRRLLARGHRVRRLAVLVAAALAGTLAVPLGVAAPAQAAVRTLAYVANAGDNTVSVIGASSNTVTATIPVGVFPVGVAVNPAGTTAYVVNSSSATVSVINTMTNTVTATIPVGAEPESVAFSPDGGTAYVTNSSGPPAATASR